MSEQAPKAAVSISQARCGNHAGREAVARCPECRGFFCRECITEHEGRLICAQCQLRLARPEKRKRARMSWVWRSAQLMLGVMITWLSFYYAGRVLIAIPPAMHDATLFQEFEKDLLSDEP